MVEHGVVVETARRVYDRDGNLVRRDLHDRWDRSADNVIFNPDNGKSVPYTSAGHRARHLRGAGRLRHA